MHECLSITEVLLLLCGELRGKSKDLLSMALCCRAFLEPALDKLWYHVKSFKPLIACLPEDLVELRPERTSRFTRTVVVKAFLYLFNSHECSLEADLNFHSYRQVLRRPIRSADLNRCQTQYARRIRIFELGRERNILVLPSEVFQDLRSATDPQLGALTPLATKLIWSSSHNPSAFPYLHLFLGQHVAKIHFEITPQAPDAMTTMRWASNHVHRFWLGLSSPSIDNTEDRLAAFIPLIPWENLQELELAVGLVTVVAIPPLMSAPRLVKLAMMLKAGRNILRPPAPSPNHFPNNVVSSLRCLDITTDDVDAALISLEYLPKRNQLESLTCFLSGGVKLPSTIHRLFDLVRSKCNPQTFSKLLLLGCSTAREGDDVSYVDISALLSLSSLAYVEIMLPALRVELTPEQAVIIPSAWPRIERLVVNATRGGGPICTTRPFMDHTHLITILRGCANLRVLGVHFDATSVAVEAAEQPNRGVERLSSRLEELIVSDLPILSSPQMAAFLTAYTPVLKKLICFPPPYVSGADTTKYRQRWDDVASRIGASIY